MCKCIKYSDGFMNELAYLSEMRELMAGPNLPKKRSVYDMEFEELEIFRKEVEEYEKNRKEKEEKLLGEIDILSEQIKKLKKK